MSQLRGSRIAIGVLVVIALMVTTAGAAQAGVSPKWAIAKAWLGAGATEGFSGSNYESFRINVPGLSNAQFESFTKGECKVTGTIVGSGLLTPGTEKAVGLTCTNMVVNRPSGCWVHSPNQPKGTVVFNSMKSTLVWMSSTGEAAGALLSAEAGGPLAELVVEGSLCEIGMGTPPPKYAVQGEIVSPFKPVAGYTSNGSIEFPEPAIAKWWNNEPTREEKLITQLTVGGKNATVQSEISLALTTGKEFAIFGG